jgi:hypothetical protein
VSAGQGRLKAISDDGQWAVYHYPGPALIVDDTNNRQDVYARHLADGEVRRISLRPVGTQFTVNCLSLGITRDSRYVGFEGAPEAGLAYDLTSDERLGADGLRFGPTWAGELEVFVSADALIEDDTNNVGDIYVRDAATTDVLGRASERPDGIEGNGSSLDPSLSSDGRLVAFLSLASNLGPDRDASSEVFVHDRVSGDNLLIRTDYPVDDGNGDAVKGVISADGRYVAVLIDAADQRFELHLAYIGDWVDGLPAP